MSMSSACAGWATAASNRLKAKASPAVVIEIVRMVFSSWGSGTGACGVGRQGAHRDPLVDRRRGMGSGVGDNRAQVPVAVRAQRIAGDGGHPRRFDAGVLRRARAEAGAVAGG